MSPSPPLILATHKLAGLSGKVALVWENARRLAAAGWTVSVLTQALDAHLPDGNGARVERVWRPPLGRRAQAAWLTRRARALALELGADGGRALIVGHGESLVDQDVLHVHNCAHRAHQEVVGEFLRPRDEPSYARLQRFVLERRRFRRVVANSKLVKAELMARYGIDPRVIDVVYPGHDAERFRPEPPPAAAEVRRAAGVREGELLVGLVTSGDLRKRGAGLFLEALSGLDAELTAKLRAVVVGRERDPERWMAVAREGGLGERVRLMEPRPDVEAYYHACDVLVHPAPWEEFGMTVLEALACGRPILVGPQVGALELLGAETRKLMPTSLEPEALRAALAKLLTDPDARRTLATAGRDAAAACTWDANVRGHAAVYEELNT